MATRDLKLGTWVEPPAHGAAFGAGRAGRGGDAGACLEGSGLGTASTTRRSLGPSGVPFLAARGRRRPTLCGEKGRGRRRKVMGRTSCG